eukprot:TRINITY_DN1690_c0_g2_i5.p2 TRINITY_DN1690_c0_g2~~TRINITY_DN1690_c0_g2_i5.p2  ORF type:complete len:271 (-),score=113.69 TRINITY_DN1690_c0_g2_i5:118-930(-)
MELSQNEKIEDPTLVKVMESMSFANYFKRILREADLGEFIASIKESIMPLERKQMLNIILTSMGGEEAVKEVKNSPEAQIAEMLPNVPLEVISKTLQENNGNIESTILALTEINSNEPKSEPSAEDPRVKMYREQVEEEERLRAQRRKEIEEEDKQARAARDEEQLALNEAAIRKTKELAAKYMYDDDEDEFSELVNQESLTGNIKDIESQEEYEEKKDEKKEEKGEEKKEEVRREMTQRERENAKKKKNIDKARRKFNKTKQTNWAKKS